MTIDQLKYFVEVCHYGNVSTAAENLHISQPSVSIAIKNLEAEFGIPLFYRRKNKLTLTEEGMYFLTSAEKILSSFHTLNDNMKKMGTLQKGFSIGVPPMISVFLFAPIYYNFYQAHPEISIEMVESGSLDTQRKLLNDEMDLGLVVLNSETTDSFHIEPLIKSRLLYCVSKDHPFSKLPSISFSMLQNEKITMMQSTSHESGAMILKRFEAAGIDPTILLRSNQLYLIKQYILNQNAGSFLIENILSLEPDIVGIPLDPPMEISIGLIWKKGNHLPSTCSRFVSYALEYCKEKEISSISSSSTS